MKQFFLAAAVAAMAAGCGSQGEAGSANANASNPADAANTAVVSVDTSNVAVINPTQSALTNSKFANRAVQNPTIGSQAVKPTAFPAPDNSEYVTTMSKEGTPVETRTFKNHPQLSKIVRTWISIKDKKTEVYLKNGKVVSVPADKLENINSVPASLILQAAGVGDNAAAPSAAASKSETKENP